MRTSIPPEPDRQAGAIIPTCQSHRSRPPDRGRRVLRALRRGDVPDARRLAVPRVWIQDGLLRMVRTRLRDAVERFRRPPEDASMITENVEPAAVLEALRVVQDPDLGRDIVSLNFVKDLRVEGGKVSFVVELTTPACPVKEQMHDQAVAAVSALAWVTGVTVDMTANVRAVASPEAGRALLPGVKNIIAVGAGKGGVGKSTVAVNLAVALSRYGGRVGIIDADVYGPNIPIMLGVRTQLETDGKKIMPAEKHGIPVVSMGFMTQDDTPIIWRGPMLHGVVQQFFREVRWDELDYLIVDMPPGTGDVALSLSQTVPVAGAVVVTTPQTVSVADSRRAVALVRGCGQGYALQTVEPVTYRCGTRRVCQARSSGSERDTRARPHAVAPMNGGPEDSRRRSTCTGRTHSPRARADGNQTPSSTVAVRAPSPS